MDDVDHMINADDQMLNAGNTNDEVELADEGNDFASEQEEVEAVKRASLDAEEPWYEPESLEAKDGVFTDNLADRPTDSRLAPYYEQFDYNEAVDEELTKSSGFLDEIVLFERGYGARVDGGVYQEGRELQALTDTVVFGAEFLSAEDTGEPLIDCANVLVQNSIFAVERPLVGAVKTIISMCDFDQTTRGTLSDSNRIVVQHCVFEGADSLSACERVHLHESEIYGYGLARDCKRLKLTSVIVEGVDAFLNCSNLAAWNLSVAGDGAFRHLENSLITGSIINGDDVLAYAKNVTLRDCVITGRRIGWMAQDLTFINCTIVGEAPLCRGREINVIDCRMLLADMAFEYSEIEASINGHINSVINPLSGTILADTVGTVLNGNARFNCSGLVYERLAPTDIIPKSKKRVSECEQQSYQLDTDEDLDAEDLELDNLADDATASSYNEEAMPQVYCSTGSAESSVLVTEKVAQVETPEVVNANSTDDHSVQMTTTHVSDGDNTVEDQKSFGHDKVKAVTNNDFIDVSNDSENTISLEHETSLVKTGDNQELEVQREDVADDAVQTINNLHNSVGRNRKPRAAGASKYDGKNSQVDKEEIKEQALSLNVVVDSEVQGDKQLSANINSNDYILASAESKIAGEPVILSPLDFMCNLDLGIGDVTFGIGEELLGNDDISNMATDDEDQDSPLEVQDENLIDKEKQGRRDFGRRAVNNRRTVSNFNRRTSSSSGGRKKVEGMNIDDGGMVNGEPSMEQYLANSYYATGFTPHNVEQEFGYSGNAQNGRGRPIRNNHPRGNHGDGMNRARAPRKRGHNQN